MRKLLLWVFQAALSLALGSCGSTSFLTMLPVQANGPSVDGHPTTSLYHLEDSVEVQLHFVRYEPTELVFDVEIGNDSSRPVVVEPATFFYAPVDTASAASPTVLLPRVPALNPEARLTHLAAGFRQEAAKAEKVSLFEVLTAVSHVAEDVASIKRKETDEQVAERKARHEDDNSYFDEQRDQHAQQADYLSAQHRTMQAVALRKTPLKPGEYVRGQVSFPRRDMFRRLRVVVFYNERPVTFDFTQTFEKQYSRQVASSQ